MHILPSHHYPAGIVTQITRRYELLALAIHESDSGLHMILEVKKENLKRFMMNAKQKRLHIVALQNFYEKTTEFSNKFILNYSSLTKNEIEEAVKVLCEF